MDVVGMRDSTRGGRRHGGLIEESILIDGVKLNEVIIPLLEINKFHGRTSQKCEDIKIGGPGQPGCGRNTADSERICSQRCA